MTPYDLDTRFAQVFAARSRSLDASLKDQPETREREKRALDEALATTRSQGVEVGKSSARRRHHHPDHL
ncbi:hypothetical protein G4G93_15110 [Methylobacterium sp. DB0501]|uniref:hypothetical protein n=1 Tax=Methylobacterium sp. DB0501 TaxID=2709665 RepID=UPI0013ECDF1D|nr:hypothetical protein [Methylobacterium sp. DB0501]NGM35234.1 hypothetical protein [Methylobacterium sp. DB0501]